MSSESQEEGWIIRIDAEGCVGCGQAEMALPGLVELDSACSRAYVLEDGCPQPSGTSVPVPPERLEEARWAVEHCPPGCIELFQEPQD
jgi:ferredoxin